jgi:hypothetical protein
MTNEDNLKEMKLALDIQRPRFHVYFVCKADFAGMSEFKLHHTTAFMTQHVTALKGLPIALHA